MKKFLYLLTIIVISTNFAFAVPAKPLIIKILQKNGTEISIQLHGDEHFNFKTTEDGILITENSNGIFEYAKINEKGKIFSTGVLAKNKEVRSKEETSFLNGINNNVNEISIKIRNERAEQKKQLIKANAPTATSAIGEKGIVILVSFSDEAFVTPDANTAFTNLLNQQGYNEHNAVGSARDYFIACSNSIFKPNFDVYGPYTLPQTLNYYGQNDSWGYDKNANQMIIDACNLAYGAGVDFSQYDTDGNGYVDNVFVFYAGYSEASGAPSNTIWPHRSAIWSKPVYNGVKVYDYACASELKGASIADGTEMAGIGTFAHEFSHVLGLPDLYNTSNSSDRNLGFWDLMDSGCYNGPKKNGDVPAMYSAYEMFYLSWFTPEILTKCDDYSLEPLENTQKKAYLVAKGNTHNLNGKNPNPIEFYMIENRQRNSFDSYLPGAGLLITRINYNSSTWNSNTINNSTKKGVEIMKAGSNISGSNWAFPYLSKNSFDFISATDNTYWQKSISEIKNNYSENKIDFYFESTNCDEPMPEEKNDIKIIYSSSNWDVIMNEEGNYLLEIISTNGILLKYCELKKETSILKGDFIQGVYIFRVKDLDNKKKTYFKKAIK